MVDLTKYRCVGCHGGESSLSPAQVQEHLALRYLYLLTSDWESEQSRAYYYGCDDISQDDLHNWNSNIPAVNVTNAATPDPAMPPRRPPVTNRPTKRLA